MPKFRKKPVVIEAEHFTEENKNRAFRFITCNAAVGWDAADQPIIQIDTLEGTMTATLGDWIIRGVKGEFYPIKDVIFTATYEPADTPAPSHALMNAAEDRA
jgi:hypothetical protein